MFRIKKSEKAEARKAAAGKSVKAGASPKRRAPSKLERPARPAAKPPRKRQAPPPADLGIGAVEVAPPKDAPATPGLQAAKAALDKKAGEVVLLDVRGLSGLCDEMLVATARSVTHLGAVSDAVTEALRLEGQRLLHSDGRHSAEPDWVLLDYGDLMVHIFRAEARQAYRLEEYYGAARLVARWKND